MVVLDVAPPTLFGDPLLAYPGGVSAVTREFVLSKVTSPGAALAFPSAATAQAVGEGLVLHDVAFPPLTSLAVLVSPRLEARLR